MKLDAKAAGERLGGATEKTLANWRCYGKGPPFYKIGGRIRYAAADLDAWLATRRRTSTGT
ncbi:MAG: helix-turn-helix domain-containing protein [Hyphomicrobium aestuarii]|nr:helix-turn-helix domain-containing protein [Hyphomicrobium aestuarii]